MAMLLAGAVRTASAQTAADLFDVGTLQEIRLLVNSKDLALLRRNYGLNTRYPADMIWRNLRVRNVSVRSRGFGSRNSTKLGLLIEFDHYTSGQRFLGLRSLVLDNEWQDPSMIREQVAMSFFNRMGMPASRESFARLYINNEYQGVYGIVENIDPDYLRRTLSENEGYLYEFHWQDYWYGEYRGDDLAPYKLLFEPRTHQLESDTQLYSPIRDLFREINGADEGVWRDQVERVLDLRQFITLVAIEVYLSEWDGLTGNWAMNNFQLYRRRGSSVQLFLPWDRDRAMTQLTGDMPIFFRTDDNVLFHRAIAYADLRELYLTVLEQCAQAAVQDDWFQNAIAQSASVVAAATYQDSKKPFTNAEFDAEIQGLMGFAHLRPSFVLQQIARARSGSQ